MFKEKLKELREQKGLSQYELADCIFVSRSTIAKWENGLGMPGKASMDSLCEFFNITKEELLKDDDPSMVIENVQKKSKKFITIILVIISLIFITYTIAIIGMIIEVKQEDLITPQNGMYYSNDYLDEFGLKNLEMIEGKDYLLMGTEGSTFYSNIDSYETFNNYAQYIYELLKYSTTISYLSCSKQVYGPKNKFSDALDIDYYDVDLYLVPSQNIEDHIVETFDNGKVHIYSFYYFTKSKEHNEKEEVNVNHIKLKFQQNNNRYFETNYNWFQMVIENDDDNDITPTIYLANEFFEIKEVSLTNQNVNQYINIEMSNYDNWLYFSTQAEYRNDEQKFFCPFQLFLQVEIQLKEKNTDNIVKSITKYVYAEEGITIKNSISDFGVNSLAEYDLSFTYEVLENSKFYLLTQK